ncbi:hypothetical protein NHH03_08640 [Stieleria sp. TO1_6]|uniref:hypothetical protein n=1 Tax=Stieleria tagensis TaxID=2956795 RepID=UPI00209B5265|nr:hypothetical protein [Stieleria tagensis]MCO8121802.1 hypothetical protein [Stieleria tagensis]
MVTSISPDAENRIPWFDLAEFWPAMTRLYIAHWFLVVTTAALALAPWCPRKFSIRATLIAVTLLATTIALIAWIDRTF